MKIATIFKYNLKYEGTILDINVPGSKSLAIRTLILASISNGTSIISNLPENDDIFYTKQVLKKLGVILEQSNSNIIIKSRGIKNFNKKAKLYLGSSGLLARFIPIILAFVDKGEYIIETSEQLTKRPNKIIFNTLENFGLSIKYLENYECYPIQLINNKKMEQNFNKIYVSGKESSQFVSAILIFASLLNKEVEVIVKDISVKHKYILMSLDSLKLFGCNNYKINEENNSISLNKFEYKTINLTIEPDINTINHLLAIAFVAKINIKINHINSKTNQPGLLFLDVLRKLGADITYNQESITLKNKRDLIIDGGFDIDMFNMAEMVPILSCLAIFAKKPIKIYNVAHIRNHETDRISAIIQELRKINIEVDEFEDGLKIYPSNPKFLEVIDSHNDHRIAMSFAMFAVFDNIKINNYDCVSKTCPDFFKTLETIGFDINIE